MAGQAIKTFDPYVLEGRDPIVNGLEPFAIEAIQPLLSHLLHRDEFDLSQDPQVLGDLRLLEVEQRGHLVHRPLASGEQGEDTAALWLRDRVEDVRRCCQACHADIVFRYGNVSNRRSGGGVMRCIRWAAEQGYRLAGKHHDIYLGDPRRADLERLKTVLRHAVERA